MNSIGTKSVREPERDFKSRHQAVLDILDGDHHYLERWLRLRRLMRKIRTSEYQITNACNLRCKGCWFFEYDFDKRTKDVKDIDALKIFLENERARGVNAALVIGGEPTLFPRRIAAFVEHIDYVTLATNGLRKFPTQCFEQVTLLVALFGGSRLDDELRAIKPGGKRFKGLFDQALKNYYQDPRAFFLFAITEDGIDQIEEAVKRIGDNGSRLHFSFYSKYDSDDPLRVEDGQRLIDTALRAKQRYPDTVASHPYYIETMITGRSHWAEFGYRCLPKLQRRSPRPRRANREWKSLPARLQHLGRRSGNDHLLLYFRPLRRLSRQPGRIQLAVDEHAKIPGKRAALQDVDRDCREFLESVHLGVLGCRRRGRRRWEAGGELNGRRQGPSPREPPGTRQRVFQR